MNPAVASTKISESRQPADVYESILFSGARLCVSPRVTVQKSDFIRDTQGPAIALDGFVRGASWMDHERRLANFNHHEEVVRPATLATCGQVKLALKGGFVEELSIGGRFAPTIWGNDCDEDVCLSSWQFAHYERLARGKSEPLINQIIEVENNLDMTGGCYPYDPASSSLRRIAWVFAPYTEARAAGRVAAMNGADMTNLIAAVHDRIDRFTLGRAEQVAVDTRMEVMGGGPGWNLIAEHGYHARLTFVPQGIRAFVSVKPLSDGHFQYSIGKAAAYSSFPVDDLYWVLNEAEDIAPETSNRWSGSDTIGGSPREGGSRLAPKEVEWIINNFLDRKGNVPRAA
jgi:hypothetical protein